MQEPEQYIFEEWDSMCAKANKSLHSDCPLLEDEVLVEMHAYVGYLGKETELKKIAQEIVSYISKRSYQSQFGDGIVVEINEKLDKLLDKLDELSKNT